MGEEGNLRLIPTTVTLAVRVLKIVSVLKGRQRRPGKSQMNLSVSTNEGVSGTSAANIIRMENATKKIILLNRETQN
jgi:hypothetical protein